MSPTKSTTITTSPAQTSLLAQAWVERVLPSVGQRPVIFALSGDLGSGKTQFVKGLAAALGVTGLVTSPSYALVNEYDLPSGGQLVHIDAWRLPDPAAQLAGLGWPDFMARNAVVALEWPPENADHKALAPDAIWILGHFEYTSDQPDHRQITLEEQT